MAMPKEDTRNGYDRILLLVTLLLLAFGLLMVFSASFVIAAESKGDPYYFLKRQALWIAIGVAGMFCISCFPYHKLKRLSVIILLLNFIFLGLIYSGFGSDLGVEARRWLVFGPIVVQPAEFSKLALIIFTAAYMSSRKLNFKKLANGSLIPLVLAMIVFFMIQSQPDLSTALIVLIGSLLVIFLAGVPIYQVAGLSLSLMPFLIYFTIKQDYRVQRLLTFIDPWAEPSGSGYQIIQSLYALGPGHIFGSGLGRSQQKLFYLPEPQNDFIFAVIGEELGFIGTVTVLLFYLIFFWRGFQIAMKAPDLFGSLLAAGITFIIAAQVLINVAVVTGSLPVTGINLPLISAGGSSVFFTLLGIGILLNISKHARAV
ncbi:MAG: putative lipid II flippase FtsW [Clostridia bacterium]|nr:putative lipid II flippase FtsW [Clostridia bacterium]